MYNFVLDMFVISHYIVLDLAHTVKYSTRLSACACIILEYSYPPFPTPRPAIILLLLLLLLLFSHLF